jgi:hypothetical protein
MNMFQAVRKQAETAPAATPEAPTAPAPEERPLLQRARDAISPLGTKEFWQKPLVGDGTGASSLATPMNLGIAAGGAALLATLLRRGRNRRRD